MADVPWTNYFGIGKGAAQVFRGNPALDDLKQEIAQNQKEKQQQVAQLNAQIAKINFGGAHDKDLPILQQGYNDVLNKFAQLRSTNNPMERSVLQNQMQQQQQALLYQAALSKENHENLVKTADKQNDPNAQLADNFHAGIQPLFDNPTLTPDFQNKFDAFRQNMHDPKVDMLSIGKKLLDNSTVPVKTTFAPGRLGNANVMYETSGKQLDDNKLATNVALEMKGDKAYRNKILSEFGSPENYIQRLRDDNAANYQPERKLVGHEFDQRPVRFSAEALWNLNDHGTPNALKDSGTPTYIQDLSSRLRNTATAKDASGEFGTLISSNPAYLKAPAFKYNGDGTYNLTVPAKYKFDGEKQVEGMPNSTRDIVKPAYTIKVDPRNATDFDTKIGNVYRDVTGDNTGIASKVNTPAGKGHVPNSQAGQRTAPIKNTIKQSDIATKAAAAGYSVKEYTDLLKQKGIKIQ